MNYWHQLPVAIPLIMSGFIEYDEFADKRDVGDILRVGFCLLHDLCGASAWCVHRLALSAASVTIIYSISIKFHDWACAWELNSGSITSCYKNSSERNAILYFRTQPLILTLSLISG